MFDSDQPNRLKAAQALLERTEARRQAPSHLIHFNGERFLGPYGNASSAQNDERV